MFASIVPIYISLIIGLPAFLAIYPVAYSSTAEARILWTLLAPFTFGFAFIVVAGLLSNSGRSAIRKGKIKRDLTEPIYGKRRLHAVPWTLLFYFSPLYFVVLVVPVLKKMTFRLFGYQGNTNFTLHPDTWIRDLPCLKIGSQAYLANKSSIATNMVLMQGYLLVDNIEIGDNSCVGMGAMIGPGTQIGNNSIVDTATLVGVRSKIGNNVRIGGMTGVQHGVSVGDNCSIGSNSFLGIRVRIAPGINIPEGSHIHPGIRLRSQNEADSYFSEETGGLTRLRSKILYKIDDLINESKTQNEEGSEVETLYPRR